MMKKAHQITNIAKRISFLVLALSFQGQASMLFDYRPSYDTQTIDLDKNQTLKRINDSRQRLIALIVSDSIDAIVPFIEDGDQLSSGVKWITDQERIMAYFLADSIAMIEADDDLVGTIWGMAPNSRPQGNAPTFLCRPSEKPIYVIAQFETAGLENVLWKKSKEHLDSRQTKGQLRPDLQWLVNNSACNNNYRYLSTEETSHLWKTKVSEFLQQFPESRMISVYAKTEAGKYAVWNGNGFLWGLGAEYTLHDRQSKRMLNNGVGFNFGMNAYFSQLMLGVDVFFRQVNSNRDLVIDDSLFLKDHNVEYSYVNFQMGYPLKFGHGLVLTPYLGAMNYTFDYASDLNKTANQNIYEKFVLGYSLGIFADYSPVIFNGSSFPKIGGGLGIRLGVQYQRTNHNEVLNDLGENAISIKLQLIGGFLGLKEVIKSYLP